MYSEISTFVLVSFVFIYSLQDCPEERTKRGIRVVWHQSKPATNVTSDPICYYQKNLVTRHCEESVWTPTLSDLPPCLRTVDDLDLSFCPPGYQRVSNANNRYCYQINSATPWSYPCLTSGGATVITDLHNDEFKSLLESLRNTSASDFFWLPAQRRKTFSPVVWTIPGPNWGQVVEREDLQVFPSLLRNCLMLDVEKGTLVTETCSRIIPSLCLYLNDFDYPSHCPNGYYRFRFMSDDGVCFGIEHDEKSNGMTFEDFINDKCSRPMGDSKFNDLTRFLFLKVAEISKLPENLWCWFKRHTKYDAMTLFSQNDNSNYTSNYTIPKSLLHGAINKNGTEILLNSSLALPCMACESQVKYKGETELQLEFIPEELRLYLTIYFPSGLWKYINEDIGVNCFSDAKGFGKPIGIENIPFIQVSAQNDAENNTNIEKTVYTVGLVTNRSAQYWCEAHNKSFSLLTSNKVIASSKSNCLHVFALVVNLNTNDNETFPDLTDIVNNISEIFIAQKVLLMDILEYTSEHMLILMHLHVNIVNDFEDYTKNLQATFEVLEQKAQTELSSNCLSFVNISSSLYCLPSATYADTILEWDLTKIGEAAAPNQFCLQSNGLPVRRHCLGSYLFGGYWGDVEGQCNETYEPSKKTTFLYTFVKGLFPENYTSRFLIDGLEFVLDDVGSIIPADIYYLSISFKHVLEIAQVNESSIEMGDLENMVWAVDRIMLMDTSYLRLAQTFNSTNVILDSVNDLIVKLARATNATEDNFLYPIYQLSIKPQFVVQISYPLFNNVTGLALVRKNGSMSETFEDNMSVMPLYANSSLEDIVTIKNLEIATWIPFNVLATLRNNENSTDAFVNSKDIHIVVSVYNSDVVFQQLDPSDFVINSRVISLTIPGCKTNLKHSIPLLFKELNSNCAKKICGFWDFDTKNSGENPGFWSSRGCYFQKSINNITVCQCYHMTNFGQLLDINEVKAPGNACKSCHSKALNVITLIGSFLSLFGISGIWITAVVFETWRKKPGTKVLLQLSTAISMPLLLMIVFNLDNTIFYKDDGKYTVREEKKVLCIILGCLMQYSILASFAWMLITAVLQFVRYVRVLGVCRPSRFIFKFAVIGWGIPLVPVAVTLATDYHNFIPDPSTEPEKRICYPKGLYLVLGVVIPIILVIIVNVVLFSLVLCSISHGPEGKMKSSDMDLIKTQLRLSLFLFFLLGLTWIFGIFSFFNNTMMWSYLFCLTSTLQGFVLFVYFVICDPATRNLWITLMKPQFQVPSPRKSVSSISSG